MTLSTIVVYVVDISGFTESWRRLLARCLNVSSLRPLPPFDCSLCAVWWVCLIYTICVREFSLLALAYCGFLSAFSEVLGKVIMLIKESLLTLLDKIFGLL